MESKGMLQPSYLLFCMMGLGFWGALYYFILKKFDNTNPEIGTRSVTLIYGTVATLIGILLCGVPSLAKCNMRIGLWHKALLIWSWSYFTFDLLWCIVYWPDQRLMIFHHLAALACCTLYMDKPNSGCIVPCSIAFLEITNPMLQVRWFIRYFGYGNTILFTMVELVFLVSFVCLRAIAGTYILVIILEADEFDLEEKILSVALYITSAGFLYQIFGYVLKKYEFKISELRVLISEMGRVFYLVFHQPQSAVIT